jgi:hypothetical protein
VPSVVTLHLEDRRNQPADEVRRREGQVAQGTGSISQMTSAFPVKSL